MTVFDFDLSEEPDPEPANPNDPPPEYWAARARLKALIADRKPKKRR